MADGDFGTAVAQEIKKRVPVTRTIAGKPLTGDVTLTARDVGAVTSLSPTRLVYVEEGEPDPPLVDGDLVIRYAVPGANFFTDFSTDTIATAPLGWTKIGVDANWQVIAEAEASGGRGLAMVGASGGARRAVAWDAVGTPGAVEMLFRWKCLSAGFGVLGFTRFNETLSPTVGVGLSGGVVEDGALRFFAGTGGSSLSQVFGTASLATVVGEWYLTRLRTNGNRDAWLSTWLDGDTEPAWMEVGTPSTIAAGVPGIGMVGFLGSRAPDHVIDWVAVATEGRTAVRP